MKKMTEKNLSDAFAGESQAHMKYAVFADKAEKEGFPNVGRLFRAISRAERAHATGHLRVLAWAGKTSENLQAAIDGETFEVDEMYPAYDSVAHLQEEKGALRSIHYALEAEKIHASMYQAAKQAVDSGKDIDIGPINICTVCGHTLEGDAPDRCPVCGATKAQFKEFS